MGNFLRKKIKILLLRNRKENEAETWHTCIALYKSYVFYSGRIRTLVAMATYSFHRLIIGKVGKELFCVKKSILVTFSVFIISLCEVKTR